MLGGWSEQVPEQEGEREGEKNNFIIWVRLAWNARSSLLRLWNTGISGMGYCAQFIIILKSKSAWAGEMAQKLRKLKVIRNVLSSNPRHQMVDHNKL